MNKRISIFAFCCLTLLQPNTRVAFSRPASLIRTPGALDSEYYNQYIVGFGGEITQFSNLNYTFSNYFKGVTSTGYNYGISYSVSHEYMTEDIASDPPSNVSFHIHKQIFKRNNIGINFGIHDMLYTTEDPHRISLFTSFSYIQDMTSDYTLESVLGFGTGALTSDSHDYGDGSDDAEGEGPEIPFFLGFKLRTPLLLDKGGLDFMFEYDGNGINAGTSIPLNSAWTINLALTNIGNIAKFGDWSSTGDLLPDATALGVGIQMNIPKLKLLF